MNHYLSSKHFPAQSSEEVFALKNQLERLIARDLESDFFALLGRYQGILADNTQRHLWPEVFTSLKILFKCGKPVALDGPMIGIPVSIRDTDYFKDALSLFGKDRSLVAGIEWMATVWNATFADTGLWMGKTYEPVSRERLAEKCENDPEVMAAYDPKRTRIGRNFFREPRDPNVLQSLGLPALNEAWHLLDRPMATTDTGFDGDLLDENLQKENVIPYTKTGGIFLANLGQSVVPEMNGKSVYQLNYRWKNLNPPFPMTRLIDEVVQIAEGIYLGQLVFASRHYNLGAIDLPFIPGEQNLTLGESYAPREKPSWWHGILEWLTGSPQTKMIDYGYQNNGFFLMMDPAYAKQVYDDDAFPQLRPHRGESGYIELGYEAAAKAVSSTIGKAEEDWVSAWQKNTLLQDKFTHFIFELSPNTSDAKAVQRMLHPGESILQMLKRISEEISEQSKPEDHLRHFEKLHQLFRSGLGPSVQNGLFQGRGKTGYNTRAESTKTNDWYGEKEVTTGFDYYHGATLNLHFGFNETIADSLKNKVKESLLFPSALSNLLEENMVPGPNVLNRVWRSIGKYIFPWSGKSFEKIKGRKLSMLLDESDDLAVRYPERVQTLKTHLASAPHYGLVLRNQGHYWVKEGKYSKHLKSGAWDQGMSEADKSFWIQEADRHWVMGKNLQDKRILTMDPMMRMADMNYQTPDPFLLALAEAGPSPFARQGYVFLGAANQKSILPTNNVGADKKRVFQFHYRYPMIGGPVPIGYCLDELVEIADGLYLGQLIYSTALHIPFHSSTNPEEYKYQLFGYFLLLDDDWQRHRLAIELDTWQGKASDKILKKVFALFN